jgi:hypothetical protein
VRINMALVSLVVRPDLNTWRCVRARVPSPVCELHND